MKGGPVHHPHPSSTSGKKDTSIKRKTSSQEKTSAPSTVGPEKSLRSAKESSPPSLRDEKRVLSRVAAATSTTATVIGIEVEMPVAGDEEGSASQEVASHPKNLEPIKVTKDLSQDLKNTEPYEHCDPVNEEDR